MLTADGAFAAGNDDGVDAGIEVFKTFAMASVFVLHLSEFIGYAAGNMSNLRLLL